MSLKVRAVLVVVIGCVLGFSLSVGGGLIGRQAAPDKEELAWEQTRLFAEVLERVKRDYVEPLDDAELLDSAIRGMVSDLDAHSQYLDADEYRDIRISRPRAPGFAAATRSLRSTVPRLTRIISATRSNNCAAAWGPASL